MSSIITLNVRMNAESLIERLRELCLLVDQRADVLSPEWREKLQHLIEYPGELLSFASESEDGDIVLTAELSQVFQDLLSELRAA